MVVKNRIRLLDKLTLFTIILYIIWSITVIIYYLLNNNHYIDILNYFM